MNLATAKEQLAQEILLSQADAKRREERRRRARRRDWILGTLITLAGWGFVLACLFAAY